MSTATLSKNQWGFSPQNIAGCQLWLDAADTTSMVFSSGTSNVTTWKDKSGNGNNGTANGTVVWSSNGLGTGLPAMTYTNTQRFYGNISITSNQFTAFAIFNMNNSTGAAGRVLSLGVTNAYDYNNNSYIVAFCRLNGTNFVSYRNGTYPTIQITLGANELTTTWIDGTTSYLSQYGGTPTTVASSGNFAISSYAIGDEAYINVDASAVFYGYISEILVYNAALTTAQRQQVEGYLAAKWGMQTNLSATHPYYATSTMKLYKSPVFARPFQPVDIPGCQLWLDGADQSSMTFSSGTTVSVWKDKSGNGYNATVLSGYTGATYSSASNCLYFPVYTTGYGTSYSANPTNETMFVVFNNPSPSANNNMVIGGPKGARSLAGGYSGTTGVGACSYLDNEVTWNGIASMPASTYTSGSTVIITGTVSNSSSSTISQNGGTTYSNSGTTFNYAVVNTYIGTDTFYTPPLFYYIGYIMEVIFFNSVLSTSQRQQVESYLAWKWGLRINLLSTHPGYTLPSYSPKFTPKSITGCYLWLDAADPTTLTFSSGTNVSTWSDKSGQGNSPTSSSGTYPTYSSSLNAVQWTGGAQQLTFPSTIANAVVNSSFTVFFVSQRTSGTENFIIRGTTGATNQNLLIGYEPLGSPAGWRFAFYANDLDTALASYVSGESPTLSCFMYSTAASYKYSFLSGSIAASGSQSSSALTGWAGAMIGGNNIWPGLYANVYEVLIYNSALSTSQRQQVEGYLAWKWGLQGSLPSAHPFAKISP